MTSFEATLLLGPRRMMVLALAFVAAVAILAPWACTRPRQRLIAGFVPGFLATYLWLEYELAWEPKLPGRIDLVLLIPLFALVWLSGLGAVLTGVLLDDPRSDASSKRS